MGHELIQNSWNFLKEKSAENSLELMIHLIGTTNAINDIPLKCLDNVHDSKNVVINDLTSLMKIIQKADTKMFYVCHFLDNWQRQFFSITAK